MVEFTDLETMVEAIDSIEDTDATNVVEFIVSGTAVEACEATVPLTVVGTQDNILAIPTLYFTTYAHCNWCIWYAQGQICMCCNRYLYHVSVSGTII